MALTGIQNNSEDNAKMVSKKKCIKCGGVNIKEYIFLKCNDCGYVVKDFFVDPKKNKKLKISYNKEDGKILIIGNKEGLEYLATCCLSVIGKNDPSGHVHLQWQMSNVEKSSVETTLEYSDDSEDYK
ncbi:MAG: hypothetical protein PHV98_06395 [Candidatus Omnitrophica bacterium]|jgi:hypothetical protein|nr:hypothetical protein [Candidatus Omnitrophota bacterium]